jgi:Ca2+-dependent lipid-binding protein
MIKETLNPDFAESIQMEFFFEKHIYLKFEVMDGDQTKQKKVGEMRCRLAEIVGAPK